MTRRKVDLTARIARVADAGPTGGWAALAVVLVAIPEDVRTARQLAARVQQRAGPQQQRRAQLYRTADQLRAQLADIERELGRVG